MCELKEHYSEYYIPLDIPACLYEDAPFIFTIDLMAIRLLQLYVAKGLIIQQKFLKPMNSL